MAKKPQGESELWVRPRQIIKGPDGERAMKDRHGQVAPQGRFLELADIALGAKKPSRKKNRPVVHDKTKKEPYSG